MDNRGKNYQVAITDSKSYNIVCNPGPVHKSDMAVPFLIILESGTPW